MIAFIDDHRAIYGVKPICRFLPIAPSTYHAHVAQRTDPAKASMRAKRDARLCADISRVFEANLRPYVADATDGFGVVLFGRPWQERC